MLNSNVVKLAEVLDKLCVEGYNTIDKCDIISTLENDFECTWDNDLLNAEIKGLCDNKFIILKYQDEDVLCLTFTPAGKELVERIRIARQNEQNKLKSKKLVKKEQEAITPVATTSFDPSAPLSQNEIMAGLVPVSSISSKAPKSNIKNFLIGLLGGILGGGISGAIITLLVLFL